MQTSEDRRKCRRDLKFERNLTHNCWLRRWRKLTTNQGMWEHPSGDCQQGNQELSSVTVGNNLNEQGNDFLLKDSRKELALPIP